MDVTTTMDEMFLPSLWEADEEEKTSEITAENINSSNSHARNMINNETLPSSPISRRVFPVRTSTILNRFRFLNAARNNGRPPLYIRPIEDVLVSDAVPNSVYVNEEGHTEILRALRATRAVFDNRRAVMAHVGTNQTPFFLTSEVHDMINQPSDDVFSIDDETFRIRSNRRTNAAFLSTVYNYNRSIEYARSSTGTYYAYLESVGVLLPLDMLDNAPPQFITRAEQQISALLNMAHANLLASTLHEEDTSKAEEIVISYDKLYHTRWRKKYKEDIPTCTICQENFKSNQKLIVLHSKTCAFHEQCIKRWFKEKPSCPNCGLEVPHTLKHQ